MTKDDGRPEPAFDGWIAAGGEIGDLNLRLTTGEQATAKANNTGVSPLRRARNRAAPVEMTDVWFTTQDWGLTSGTRIPPVNDGAVHG